jgi:cytoskeletal protein CcmA (bactofilin family)
MQKMKSPAVIGADLTITGDVRNGGDIDIVGVVEGSVSANHVSVHPGGRVTGSLIASSARIAGDLRGNVLVRNLLEITGTGRVEGDVRYGRLAVQDGGLLDADVRNVPPTIAGDLNITVQRGGAALITTEDLTAIDPDSAAGTLSFAVSQARSGHVARANARATPVERFTQTDVQMHSVVFVHDGSGGESASFDVVVTDHAGATSGAAKTVHVAVFR